MTPMRERAEKFASRWRRPLVSNEGPELVSAVAAELTAVWNEAVEKCAKVALIRVVSGCPCEGCATRQGIADAQRALKLPEGATAVFPDEEMVERVARAIWYYYERRTELDVLPSDYGAINDGRKDHFRAVARAALAAMRG